MTTPARPALASFLAVLLATSAHAGDNLVVNGGAESGDVTGWTIETGGGYLVTGNPDVVHAGDFSFHGGSVGPEGALTQELYQDIDVSPFADDVDAGLVTVDFSAYGRSNQAGGTTDEASVVVEYRNAVGAAIDSFATGIITPVNQWILVADQRVAPVGTRTIRVRLQGRRIVGLSTDAFHDDVRVTLEVATPVAAASWSRIKALHRGPTGPPRSPR